MDGRPRLTPSLVKAGDAPVGDAPGWTNAFAAGAGFGLVLVLICLALLVALLRRRTT